MEKVVFDIERCKGCELCTTVCPRGIVIIDKSLINSQGFHPATVIEQISALMWSCARICPDLVITVFKYD